MTDLCCCYVQYQGSPITCVGVQSAKVLQNTTCVEDGNGGNVNRELPSRPPSTGLEVLVRPILFIEWKPGYWRSAVSPCQSFSATIGLVWMNLLSLTTLRIYFISQIGSRSGSLSPWELTSSRTHCAIPERRATKKNRLLAITAVVSWAASRASKIWLQSSVDLRLITYIIWNEYQDPALSIEVILGSALRCFHRRLPTVYEGFVHGLDWRAMGWLTSHDSSH